MKPIIQKIWMVMAMLCLSISASAYDFEVDGIYYNILSIDNLFVEVTYGDCLYKGNISVPSHVVFNNTNFKVTSIGRRCFEGCQGLLEISLPEDINIISDRSFFGCSSLSKIRLPDSVLNIGKEAFKGCTSLESVNLPIGLEVIEEYTFSGCVELKDIKIPSNINVIREKAFEGTINLTSITLEDHNVPIEIYGCYKGYYDDYNKWHSAWLPAFHDSKLSVLYCGRDIINRTTNGEKCKPAFSDQKALMKLTIGPDVSIIRQGQFSGLSKLSYLQFSSGLKSIEANAFSNCSSILSIQLPNTLQFIGAQAFFGCEMLEGVQIPSSVMEIQDCAFSKCNNLRHLIIDDSRENLVLGHGDQYKAGYDHDFCGLFGNLPIEDIYLGRNLLWSNGTGGYNYYAPFCYLNNLEVVTIAGEITEFDYLLFQGNPTIKYLTLGSNIRCITDGSFERCDFKEITCLSTNPPNAKHTVWGNPPVFSNITYATSELFVPIGSLEMYKSNELWSKFINIAETIAGIDDINNDKTHLNILVNSDGFVYTGVSREYISIYKINGGLYYSGYLEPNATFPLCKGFYIMRFKNKSFKIKI